MEKIEEIFNYVVNNYNIIIDYACACVTAITTVISIICGFSKNKKAKQVKLKTEKLTALIKEAETMTGYSGNEKLNYVLSRFSNFCSENKIKYDENETTNEINNFVELTNEVNAKDGGSTKWIMKKQ